MVRVRRVRVGAWPTGRGHAGRLSDSYQSLDAFGITFGRYQAQAASVAAHAGCRVDVGHGGYIEQQAQAACGMVGPSSYTASNRVHVEVGRNRTSQSRVGILGGHAFALQHGRFGDVSIRMAVVHTVGHRPDITAALDGGPLPVTLPVRHETTGEATVGAYVGLHGAWTAFAEAGSTSKSDVVA